MHASTGWGQASAERRANNDSWGASWLTLHFPSATGRNLTGSPWRQCGSDRPHAWEREGGPDMCTASSLRSRVSQIWYLVRLLAMTHQQPVKCVGKRAVSKSELVWIPYYKKLLSGVIPRWHYRSPCINSAFTEYQGQGTELVTGHTVVLTDQTVPPQNSYIEFLTADTSG